MVRRSLFALAVVVVLSAAAVTTQVQTGPTHYWTFDETSGAEVFDSVGGVTGTMTATVTRVPGVVGAGALDVEPTNQSFVSFGPTIGQFGTSDFSFSLWIRTNEAAHSDVVGTRIDGTFGNYVQVRLSANNTVVEISEDLSGLNFAVASGRTISDSQWHLLSVRRDATALSLFIDGQLEQTVNASGIADLGVAGRDFRIGFSLTGCCAGFHSAQMQVDDFKIWDRALLDTEVAAMHFATPPQDALPGGNPPPPPPPPPPAVCEPLDPATIAPVRLVKDFNTTCTLGPDQLTGVNGSSQITPVNSKGGLAFLKDGTTLWSTRGTEATTLQVKTGMALQTASSFIATTAWAGDRLVFGATTVDGRGLWVSDGTPEGTALLVAFTSNFGEFASSGDRAFFTATTAAEGSELWVTDGTTGGTGLVIDLAPGALGTTPGQFAWALGRLWFAATTNGQRELWVTDGTAAGTSQVADLNGTGGGFPSPVAVLGDRVVFHAEDVGIGRELFVTDGTPAGTSLLMDTRSGSLGGLGGVNNRLYKGAGRLLFVATDGLTGFEAWTTDGTTAGTVPLGDLSPGTGSSMSPLGNSPFTAFGGRAYFGATTPTSGNELWATDGTPEGTNMVADLNPGVVASNPRLMTVAGDRLFLRATVGFDTKLYSTDGTAPPVDLNPTGRPTPNILMALGDGLIFNGFHPATGTELWSVHVDAAPSISVTHTANGAAGWTRTSPANVTVTASDPDDESVAPSCTVNDIPTTVAGDSLEISTQGAHVVVCSVTDSAGHTASASITLKVDSIAPILTITHSPDGPNGSNVNPPVTVAVTVADEGGSPIGSPACYLDGVPTALTSSGGGYALTLTDEGVYEIECAVADEAGNPSAASVTVTIDTDQDDDGVPDADDAFPMDATETADADGDGIGDNGDLDDDNDGAPDTTDTFPLDAAESLDTDGDGLGNNADADDDNDGVLDAEDALPLNGAESVDTDGDGIGNNADTDDDGDGTPDATDAFPLNGAESVDTDGDGIGDNGDTDDDNDGAPDTSDAFPLNAAESLDTDGDGIGNNADTDDDGDGTADATDAFPLDATESVDTDGDGIGNNADTDDDNDGVPDVSDPSPLTQPADTSAEAVASLEALLTSASGSDIATIERAIDYLASSTASTFWADPSHLSEDGDRVLQDLHQALVKLSAVADPEPELVAVMAAIAGITRNVAAVIIADAIAAHGATPQSDAALRALADGDAAIQAGYFKAAQTAYTIAWRQGTNAVQ
jgi:ELWxxDGT repeat protein